MPEKKSNRKTTTPDSELYAYVRKQVDDSEKLNKKLAEMLALLTCEEQSNSRKSIKFDVTPKSKDILSGMNRRVKSIYSNLPLNAMLIICTGHGDTAFVQRWRRYCLSIHPTINNLQ